MAARNSSGVITHASTTPLVFHTAARGELSTELPMPAWAAVDFEVLEHLIETGDGWDADDSKPAIPRVPGPRQPAAAPVPVSGPGETCPGCDKPYYGTRCPRCTTGATSATRWQCPDCDTWNDGSTCMVCDRARADVDTLLDQINQWRQEEIDAAYAELAQQHADHSANLDDAVAYELTLAGWTV